MGWQKRDEFFVVLQKVSTHCGVRICESTFNVSSTNQELFNLGPEDEATSSRPWARPKNKKRSSQRCLWSLQAGILGTSLASMSDLVPESCWCSCSPSSIRQILQWSGVLPKARSSIQDNEANKSLLASGFESRLLTYFDATSPWCCATFASDSFTLQLSHLDGGAMCNLVSLQIAGRLAIRPHRLGYSEVQ